MIDFRSDTVTQPCEGMRQAMYVAEVGDDTYDGDPTVGRLEALAAEMFGKEAAMYSPSGTQSNLVGLLTHCQRGEEYITGHVAHTYKYEAGGAAVLGGIQPQTVEFEADGSLDLDKVKAVIKPYDIHFAKTKLFCLENTLAGKVLPLDYIQRAGVFCQEHKLSMHLDGARVFNAAVASGDDVADIAAPFDSVSLCLSKGLGAPVGALLLGSRDFVARAKHWRKMVGGGLRQSGIMAASGIYALDHNIERLAEDHEKAQRFVDGLKNVEVLAAEAQTSMAFVSAPNGDVDRMIAFMRERGVNISGGTRMRLVMHKDVSFDDVDTLIAAFREYCDTL
jgi:threonine aldolase